MGKPAVRILVGDFQDDVAKAAGLNPADRVDDAGPQRSAFLTSFFALVGTHGLHVSFGIVWLLVLMAQVGRYGLTGPNQRRLFCLSMFWHFLDVVWIGVFTFVYLMGVLP